MRAIIVIPARYNSSRFPGKPLALIAGMPMIIRVANTCAKAIDKKYVYIATDDKRIKDCADLFGFNSILTSKKCKTGTDRVAEVSKKIKADIYVNVQGDEPLVNFNDIKKIIQYKKLHFDKVINAYSEIKNLSEVDNRNIPKVLFNKDKKLIYMSRLAIPAIKNDVNLGYPVYFKQVCIYAYNKDELSRLSNKKTTIEMYEDIEILRFFDLNVPVLMVKVFNETIAVDIPDDITKVELLLMNNKNG